MKNADQPAFGSSVFSDTIGRGVSPTAVMGLTKRELISAMAMQGLLANAEIAARFPNQDDFFHAVWVQSKYVADELLKQLES